MAGNLRHGDARAGQVRRLHNIWRGILKRCNPDLAKPNAKYAARGIRVCEEWTRYETFRAWALSNGYADSLTIERVDNDGPYAPGNCTWVPDGQQAQNRRTTRNLTHDGRTMCLTAWAREASISSELLGKRLQAGWPLARALTMRPGPQTGRPKRPLQEKTP